MNHIPGILKAADAASRHVPRRKRVHRSLWWYGPPWLLTNEQIPIPLYNPLISEINQAIETASNATYVSEPPGFILKLSKFSKLSRVTA